MMLPLCLIMVLITLLITSLIPSNSSQCPLDHLPHSECSSCVVPESKILSRMWSLSAGMAVTLTVTASFTGLPTQLPAYSALKVERYGKSSPTRDLGEGWLNPYRGAMVLSHAPPPNAS